MTYTLTALSASADSMQHCLALQLTWLTVCLLVYLVCPLLKCLDIYDQQLLPLRGGQTVPVTLNHQQLLLWRSQEFCFRTRVVLKAHKISTILMSAAVLPHSAGRCARCIGHIYAGVKVRL